MSHLLQCTGSTQLHLCGVLAPKGKLVQSPGNSGKARLKAFSNVTGLHSERL